MEQLHVKYLHVCIFTFTIDAKRARRVPTHKVGLEQVLVLEHKCLWFISFVRKSNYFLNSKSLSLFILFIYRRPCRGNVSNLAFPPCFYSQVIINTDDLNLLNVTLLLRALRAQGEKRCAVSTFGTETFLARRPRRLPELTETGYWKHGRLHVHKTDGCMCLTGSVASYFWTTVTSGWLKPHLTLLLFIYDPFIFIFFNFKLFLICFSCFGF